MTSLSSPTEVNELTKVPRKRLWLIQFAFFTFCAGQAAILPYLSVYMKQSGVSTYEAAIMSCISTLISLVTRPLFGIISDRLQIHKCMLIVCMAATVLLFGSLNFVPSRNQTLTVTNLTIPAILSESSKCNLTVETTEQDCFQWCSLNSRNGTFFLCEINEANSSCESFCDWSFKKNETEVSEIADPMWFVMWVILRTLAFAFLYPAISLLDSVTYMVLDPHRNQFGKGRFAGSIGYCVASLAAAAILFALSEEQVNFFAVIVIYSVLTLSCCVAVFFYRYSPDFVVRRTRDVASIAGKRSKRIVGDLKAQLSDPETLMLLFYQFCLGYSSGMWNMFMYWVYNDLGTSTLTIGVALTLSSLCEILTVRFSGLLIAKFSEPVCLIVVSALSSIEFVAYALVRSPWLLLLVQPLTGANFGLNVVVHSVYVTRLSSANTIAVMQGIASCVYVGLGQTTTALLGGYLYGQFGSIVLLGSCSALNFLCFLLYSLVYRVVIRRRRLAAERLNNSRAGNVSEVLTALAANVDNSEL